EHRYVLLAEDRGVGAEPRHGRLQSRPGVIEVEQSLGETYALLVRLREDFRREPKVCLLFLGVSGVAGVGDHRQGPGFVDQLLELRPALEPFLHVFPREWRGRQFFVIGRNIRPAGIRKCGRGIWKRRCLHDSWVRRSEKSGRQTARRLVQGHPRNLSISATGSSREMDGGGRSENARNGWGA